MIFFNFISFLVGMMFLKKENGDKVSDIYTHMVYIGNKTSPIRSLSYTLKSFKNAKDFIQMFCTFVVFRFQ